MCLTQHWPSARPCIRALLLTHHLLPMSLVCRWNVPLRCFQFLMKVVSFFFFFFFLWQLGLKDKTSQNKALTALENESQVDLDVTIWQSDSRNSAIKQAEGHLHVIMQLLTFVFVQFQLKAELFVEAFLNNLSPKCIFHLKKPPVFTTAEVKINTSLLGQNVL